jgi:hypothetical protein
MIELYHWGVGGTIGMHRPPVGGMALNGKVRNHPHYDDGMFTITRPVISCEGRIVEVEGGMKYRLTTINPLYRRWLKLKDIHFNAKQPIVIRTPKKKKVNNKFNKKGE